ncbi:hypothetical protein PVL29_019205 [Vitis rotundifolia]|uniref:Transcription factor MYB35 n=1 Tax=Vitis rotundifolia TaxID=103349 RepID=A0AA38Z740_VITRO|nr:hypothetical protein PVL29_019205 [Vitis rotundifolia]
MVRPPCCDKLNVKRGLWTAEEDAKILAYVSKHGIGNWTLVPKKAGLNRCGKSCRLRWTNYLRPDLKHDGFTPQEEDLIVNLHKAIGSRWSLIAKELPGRTDNDVKNYWNTKLRKKLTKMGIDPVTHKPFSQILTDYGNISGLPNTATRMGSFSRGLNNASVSVSGLSYTNMNDLMPLVEQFQVLNQETVQPHFFSEVPSSSSSSSSCSNVTQLSSPQSFPCQPSQAQFTPSSPFSWNDFLLGDPFLPTDLQQQEECDPQGTFSSTSPSLVTQNEFPYCKFNGLGYKDSNTYQHGATTGDGMENSHKASSSPASSFVESILDRDSEMRAKLPELLGESFDYLSI